MSEIIIVYHCTTKSALKSIIKSKAIIPQASNGASLSFDEATKDEIKQFKGYTFFATTFNKAAGYSEYFNLHEDTVVVLELELPTEILLPDTSDCYDCKTWQESSNKIQQVKVLGKVDSSYIKVVHLYDCKEEKVIESLGFNVWKENLNNNEVKKMSFKRLIRKNNGNEKTASVDIKTMPGVAKTRDFHLSLSDYVYNELRKNKHKVKKMNDLTIHLALEKTTDPNYDSMIIDCLDGKIYLRGIEQRDKQIGRLRNFKGDRASDAYHCMKSSIQKILSRIEKYRVTFTDYR